MEAKRILIVSSVFYPRISPRSFRATELAKEFAKQGHIVNVLTRKQSGFNYSEFTEINNVVIDDFVKDSWCEITGNNYFAKGLRFLLNRFFLFPDVQLIPLLKSKLMFYSNFDLLISISRPYPVLWGVALARNKNLDLTKVWVADCGDPFIGKENKNFIPFYFRLLDKMFCKKPDFITIPIKEAIAAYHSSCQNKIRIIPQGFNFVELEKKTSVRNEFPVFAYAGVLSLEKRNPSSFLNYLCEQKDRRFKFIIYTQNYNVLESYLKLLGNKLEIRDYVPREVLLKELGKADFLVNFENNNNFQRPSKLIDYALTGKPILSVNPSSLDTETIQQFLNYDYSNQLIISNIEQYNIRVVVNNFLKLLKT